MKKANNLTYSKSIENIDHVQIKERYNLFIDGKFIQSNSKNYFKSINPSNNKTICEIAEADKKDIDKAVKSARKAFVKWSKIKNKERAKYIFRIARMIQEKSRELSIIETLDGGKPIRESKEIDVPLAAQHFFYYAGWADKLEYAFPNQAIDPIGVAGQIIPWNFPLLMAAWKIAPALATGNTVVLKPAETTSITALKLAEIIQESGLPKGVVNIVTGPAETGKYIVNHKGIDKIAFTGSTEVGRMITRITSGSGKKVTLELGGKGANIIFSDAAIDQAIEGIVDAIFFNQGHVCCAGSRLFIQANVAEIVVEKLKKRLDSLILGNPLDKNTDIGAINSIEQLNTINKYIEIGKKEGGDIYQSKCKLPSSGNWCPPTLFLNVSQSHRIVQEEIFGPVLTIQIFRTIDEVIEKANNTPYGLAAGVWTEKGSKVFHLSKRLKSGVIWANTYNKFDATSPFGGYKESGIGREGGLHGLYSYLNFKK